MDGFKLFWEAYPNAQGLFPAMTAYVNAVKDDGATEQEIINGAREYRKYVQQNKIEQRYIKYPSNWLREGHYYNRYETNSTSANTIQQGIVDRGAIQSTDGNKVLQIPERNKRST
jgi:hypothetical protein|tara:strand:+ start:8412 stop:8756 length:345 start_codon:yes stop_codon:yes gene_type:complete